MVKFVYQKFTSNNFLNLRNYMKEKKVILWAFRPPKTLWLCTDNQTLEYDRRNETVITKVIQHYELKKSDRTSKTKYKKKQFHTHSSSRHIEITHKFLSVWYLMVNSIWKFCPQTLQFTLRSCWKMTSSYFGPPCNLESAYKERPPPPLPSSVGVICEWPVIEKNWLSFNNILLPNVFIRNTFQP